MRNWDASHSLSFITDCDYNTTIAIITPVTSWKTPQHKSCLPYLYHCSGTTSINPPPISWGKWFESTKRLSPTCYHFHSYSFLSSLRWQHTFPPAPWAQCFFHIQPTDTILTSPGSWPHKISNKKISYDSQNSFQSLHPLLPSYHPECRPAVLYPVRQDFHKSVFLIFYHIYISLHY